MAESMISLAYGKALFNAAKNHGKTEQILLELRALSWLLDGEPEFRHLLCSREWEAETKAAIIEAVMGSCISRESIRFVQILAEKERLWHFDRIVRQYERLYEKEEGFLPQPFYSGTPLKLLQEKDVCSRMELFFCA